MGASSSVPVPEELAKTFGALVTEGQSAADAVKAMREKNAFGDRFLSISLNFGLPRGTPNRQNIDHF